MFAACMYRRKLLPVDGGGIPRGSYRCYSVLPSVTYHGSHRALFTPPPHGTWHTWQTIISAHLVERQLGGTPVGRRAGPCWAEGRRARHYASLPMAGACCLPAHAALCWFKMFVCLRRWFVSASATFWFSGFYTPRTRNLPGRPPVALPGRWQDTLLPPP